MIKGYKETDGKCFAAVASNEGCLILSFRDDRCGTYACPFYKPMGCKTWVRLDGKNGVALMTKQEYFKLYGKGGSL